MLRPRCVVLGLDGLPLLLARELAATGELPHLARIAEHAWAMDAELPELSPVNWTSFFTAAGPGTHGVFGFARMDPATYRTRVTNVRDVACPTVFDRLGERGLVSRVVNLPNTYPAPPIHGMLVSGFVAEELSRAAHPPFLAAQLAQKGYVLEADTERGAQDPDVLLAELARTLDSRRTALDLLWPDLAWDCFVFVLTETDRLLHFLHPAVAEADHPLRGPVLGLLRRWDALVGEVLERWDALPEPKRLIVLADHGFGPLEVEVDVNAWLREHGFLVQTGPAGEWDPSTISPQARAFALDPGRVYAHDARFARGGVAGAERPALLEDIRRGLEALTWNGRRVIEGVLRGADLYEGPCAAHAPDLVCVPAPGVCLTAKFDARPVFGRTARTGAHRPDGALAWDSSGAPMERVRDAGRNLLDFFGIDNDHRP